MKTSIVLTFFLLFEGIQLLNHFGDRGANKLATSGSWVAAGMFVNWLNTSSGNAKA